MGAESAGTKGLEEKAEGDAGMPFIEIKSCTECKECESSRDYTADSFETDFRYECRKVKQKGKPRNIARYGEWKDPDPEVPN